MTKQDAINEMKLGFKISHRWFSDNEWMTIEGNKILTEEGYKHNMNEFWSYRTDKSWDEGYYFFEGK